MVAEHMEIIGAVGMYHKDGLDIPVNIINARFNWGKLHYKIVPVGGAGYKWVSDASVSFGNGSDKNCQSGE